MPALWAFLAVAASAAQLTLEWGLGQAARFEKFRHLEAEWGARGPEACVALDGAPGVTATQVESARMLAVLRSVPAARSLLELGLSRGTLLCQGDMHGQKAYFDNTANLLAVKKDQTFWQKAVIMVHELQHMHHHALGFERTLQYSKDEAVRFTFAVEADAQAIATLAAWQLKSAGHPDAWKALWSFVQYRPATRAFQDAMAAGASEAAAARAAFAGWHSGDWLTSSYRGQAVTIHLDELDRTKKLESFRHAPLSFYEKLCRLPDGFSYDCRSVMPEAAGLATGPMMPQRESDVED